MDKVFANTQSHIAPRIIAYGSFFRVHQGGTHIGECAAVYYHEEVRMMVGHMGLLSAGGPMHMYLPT